MNVFILKFIDNLSLKAVSIGIDTVFFTAIKGELIWFFRYKLNTRRAIYFDE